MAIDLSGQLDSRLEHLREWLAKHFDGGPFTLAPASADASFRRYFRVTAGAQSWIAMDAPPERENCRPFIGVAALMRAAGLNVPDIIAQDLEHGFLLLTDLGTTTYLQAFIEGGDVDADALFRDAIDALLRLQRASRPGTLPDYDEALLRRETELFPQWYVGRHLGAALDADDRRQFDRVVDRVLAECLAQARVYVHRDFMPRNLMLSEPNPGVLDFQDAVYGPVTYDVVSLFRDAFMSWEEERVLDWTVRYWERAKRAGIPVNPDFAAFYRGFEWMGVQRHLKVLGIFARIRYRDGKPGYLEDAPRFVAYIMAAARRYPELSPLARLIDKLADRAPAVGYTF